MDINSIQGNAAYTANTTPPAEKTATENQNVPASQTQLSSQSGTAAQQAFEVSITQEARDLLSQQTNQAARGTEPPAEQPSAEAQPPLPAETPMQNNTPAGEATQILNIVA